MNVLVYLYITGNMYLREICGVLKIIGVAEDGNDFDIRAMTLAMKSKYDKYLEKVLGIPMCCYLLL